MPKLGIDCKLYIMTGGTIATPTWTEVKKIGDLTLNLERAEVDISSRESEFKLYYQGMVDAGAEFEYRDEGRGDTILQRFRNSFFGRSNPVYLQIIENDDTEEKVGIKGYFVVNKFTRNEPLDDKVVYQIAIKPTVQGTDYPAFVDAAAV